jgi:cell division protein ZipA
VERQPPPARTTAAEGFDDVSEPRVVGRNPAVSQQPKGEDPRSARGGAEQRPFTGVSLGAALRRAGLELGEMSIYHYRDAVSRRPAEPLFSVANMVAPGTLTDDDIADMMTPGRHAVSAVAPL